MSDLHEEMSRTSSSAPKLRIDAILEAMDDDDKASLLAALNDDGVQNQRISHVLTDRGWPVSWSAVRNWRARN